VPETTAPAPVPRGRHAPPLEVRLRRQRGRLFAAAADVFARCGYADASAEAISREAGMSKATFYEHFANKEECILALFDESARGIAREMLELLSTDYATGEDRLHAGVTGFVDILARQPALAQTVLVESVGAGPRTMEHRDRVLETFAGWLYDDNRAHAARLGTGVFATRDDAFAVIGAIFELVSRQLRTGRPAAPTDLVPVIERVVRGALTAPAP
jgi:AcrR family transcriptional regulator